jgi:hypothetical protein
MLQKAQLEWLDRELASHNVASWVMKSIRNDEMGSMRLFAAIAWLENNHFKVESCGNQTRLLKDGKELSRFVWTVE